jgi:hypothetical protein
MRILTLLSFILFSSVWLTAQTVSLSGTVRDSSQAPVPKVIVKLREEQSGILRNAETSTAGTYAFPYLKPGSYEITVEAAGFNPSVRSGFVLEVGQRSILDFRLEIGARKEIVEVAADSGQGASAALGTTVDPVFVNAIPLNGRTLQSLIAMTPGVVLSRISGLDEGQFSVNGQRANTNYFTIDGVSANIGVPRAGRTPAQSANGSLPGLSLQGTTNNLVSIDAMREFRIETSTYAPEYGRTPGAQVMIATRSGSNNWSGSAYYYLRNDAFDANDWFANRAGLAKPALRQNQYGGTFGGPLIRNRTFFFASYEGLRLRQPQARLSEVPSLASRELAVASIRPILNLFPRPNGRELPGGFAEFSAAYSDPSSLDAGSIRIDHTFSNRVTAFGRYNDSPSSIAQRGVAPRPVSNVVREELRTQTLTGGLTISAKPRFWIDSRLNFSRNVTEGLNIGDDFGGAQPASPSLLFPSFASPDSSNFQLSLGTLRYLTGRQGRNVQNQWNLVQTASLIAGAHSMKFGFDWRRLNTGLNPATYFINPSFTTLAQSLTGRTTQSTVSLQGSSEPVFKNYSLFAQDEWRLAARLTLTYGLRWEVNPPPGEAKDNLPFVLSGLGNPESFALAPRGTPLWNTSYANFAPRIGLAYRLRDSSTRSTILRGGFGVFYDLGTSNAARAFTGVGFDGTATIPAGNFPFDPPVTAPPQISLNAPFSFAWGFDRNLRLPYTLQWNVALEHALTSSDTVTATYAAAVGRRLLRLESYFRPNAQFSGLVLANRSSATSDYHSLQLRYQRRLTRGVQALASYTWSHSIDTISGDTGFGPLPLDTTNPLSDRGSSDFDVRHNFTAAASWTIPKITTKSAFASLTRDWFLDSFFRYRSALPVSPFFAGGTAFGLSPLRPNLVTGVPLYLSDANVAGGRRLNAAAFAIPSPVGPGTLGRNVLRGFGFGQLDLSARRRFALTEKLFLEFRADAFNLTNTPAFANPTEDVRSGLFGIATQMLGRGLGGVSPLYQAGGPRSMQLSLRIGF